MKISLSDLKAKRTFQHRPPDSGIGFLFATRRLYSQHQFQIKIIKIGDG
jgi:hypothetical protein